mmetsp:Transcript_11293/g.23799  ORF Transcript_11293/g.23799 Transcript_11293/m.23799 type:complete len:883 (-) Transcript_11293:34-2682(-)
MAPSKQVLRSIYRSLLRSSAPFSPPHPSYPVYASLLHRTGISHDWEECIYHLQRRRERQKRRDQRKFQLLRRQDETLASLSTDEVTNGTEEETKTIPEKLMPSLPKEWARNLTRGYADLQEEYATRLEYFENHPHFDIGADLDDDDSDDDEEKVGEPGRENEVDSEHPSEVNIQKTREALLAQLKKRNQGDIDDDMNDDDFEDEKFIDFLMGPSNFRADKHQLNMPIDIEEDPKNVLFRHLLREWFSGTGIEKNHNDGQNVRWSPDGESYVDETGNMRKVPLMRFPCQIAQMNGEGSNGGGLSIRDLIRREFRAPTVEEVWLKNQIEKMLDTPEGTTSSRTAKHGQTYRKKTMGRKRQQQELQDLQKKYPPSSFIDNDIRIQTAFYALPELNRKLAWAEQIGFPAPTSQQLHRDRSELEKANQHRRQRRLAQAAKGVSHFPKSITKHEDNSNAKSSRVRENDKDDAIAAANSRNEKETTHPNEATQPTNPLQCGTYLVAHPLMTGYFAKTVIILLDHTEVNGGSINDADQESGGGGGTYGLIINRLALEPKADSSRKQWEILSQQLDDKLRKLEENRSGPKSDILRPLDDTVRSDASAVQATNVTCSRQRPIPLLRAIEPGGLPETVQIAFGDAPIREGGPVNLSLQMLHRKCVDAKNKFIHCKGAKVQDVEGKNGDGEKSENWKGEEEKYDIGGTMIPSLMENCDETSEDSIFFGGDVVKASYTVIDGINEGDDFSFVIGASCWAPGQLESEIQRGCWLPFRGCPQMAMTGMCEHNDLRNDKTSGDGDDFDGGNSGGMKSKLGFFPPRPSNALSPVAGVATAANAKESTSAQRKPLVRPVGDLWLSIICALGEGEADLAHMMLDNNNVMNEFGDACDNYER